MNHRIAAGVIVEHEDRILLVHHHKPGVYDFWVAPGGGAEGHEDLRDTARREVFEESGLHVEPQQIAYIEEFTTPQLRECKVWFIGHWVGGELNVSNGKAGAEHIVAAAWLHLSEFQGRQVFPPMLHSDYWVDKASGFALPRYVGVRALTTY